MQGSNDGALSQNARVLSKLLEQRPHGSMQFVELQVCVFGLLLVVAGE